jgi:ribosomal protein L12E/L44/L45/RPP1/RPP2
MDGDKRGSRAPFEEVLQEVDTPVERARLVRVVHALMDDGVVDVIEAAVAAFELSTASRELLRAWLTDAIDARIKHAGHRHERRARLQRQQRTRTRRSHPPPGPSSG